MTHTLRQIIVSMLCLAGVQLLTTFNCSAQFPNWVAYYQSTAKLMCTEGNNLWLNGNGIIRYNISTGHIDRYDRTNTASFTSYNVSLINTHNASTIYANDDKGDIYRFYPAQNAWQLIYTLGTYYTRVDNNQNLWIFDGNNILTSNNSSTPLHVIKCMKYDPLTNQLTDMTAIMNQNLSILPYGSTINDIFFNQANEIIFCPSPGGTKTLVYSITNNTWQVIQNSSLAFSSIKFQDDQGRYWGICSGGGIFRSSDLNTMVDYSFAGNGSLIDIYSSGSDVWMTHNYGTQYNYISGGLYHFDSGNGLWVQKPQNYLHTTAFPNNVFIAGNIIPKGSDLWVGSGDINDCVTLTKFNGTSFENHFIQNNITNLPKETYFSGIYNYLLYASKTGTGKLHIRNGVGQWIGMHQNSVWEFAAFNAVNTPYRFDLSTQSFTNATSLLLSSTAGNFNGIVKFGDQNQLYSFPTIKWWGPNGIVDPLDTPYYNMPGEDIRDICVDPSGNLWMVGGCGCFNHGGLFKKAASTGIWSRIDAYNSNMPTHEIAGVGSDALGNIYTLHNTGLLKYNGTSFTMYPYTTTTCSLNPQYPILISSGSGEVNIVADNNNHIWGLYAENASCGYGLLRFDGSNFTHYNQAALSGIPPDDVFKIQADKNKNIWFATHSHGLIFYDAGTQQFTNYNRTNSPFYNDTINDITIDYQNTVWISNRRAILGYNHYQTISGIYDLEAVGDGFNSSLNIYPNPAGDYVNVKFTLANSDAVSLSLYDLNGQKVKEIINGHREKGEYEITIERGGLDAGIYLLQLVTKEGVASSKVVFN